MKINIEIPVTVVVLSFMIYGAYLIETNHEIIGACLLAAAVLFILILLGRAAQSKED